MRCQRRGMFLLETLPQWRERMSWEGGPRTSAPTLTPTCLPALIMPLPLPRREGHCPQAGLAAATAVKVALPASARQVSAFCFTTGRGGSRAGWRWGHTVRVEGTLPTSLRGRASWVHPVSPQPGAPRARQPVPLPLPQALGWLTRRCGVPASIL